MNPTCRNFGLIHPFSYVPFCQHKIKQHRRQVCMIISALDLLCFLGGGGHTFFVPLLPESPPILKILSQWRGGGNLCSLLFPARPKFIFFYSSIGVGVHEILQITCNSQQNIVTRKKKRLAQSFLIYYLIFVLICPNFA